MKYQSKIFSLLFIICAAVSISFANNIYDAASTAITAKLQEDLADSKLELKISKAQTYQVSKSLMGLKGQGNAEGLIVDFDIKLKKNTLVPTSIKYEITENFLDSSNVEVKLTRQILNKVNQDLKTTNIVVAINSFTDEAVNSKQTKTIGSGEISIDSEWKKINFEIIENTATKEVVKISYKLL